MGKSCENLSNVGTKQTFYKKPIASHAIRLEGFSCSHIAFHSCFGDLKSTQSRQTVSHKYKLFVLWYLVTFCKYFGVDGLPPFSRYLRKQIEQKYFCVLVWQYKGKQKFWSKEHLWYTTFYHDTRNLLIKTLSDLFLI